MKRYPHMVCPRQRGQAILLIMLVSIIAVLIGLSLINAGILTSEKMQLQNAADATAYSVSVVEARDLNFTAYTNRAMVANEVAMGQMVGVMSWAVMANSSPEFLNLYLRPLISALYGFPPTSPIAAGLEGVINFLRAVTRVVRRGADVFARRGSPVIATFNRGYSIAQRSMHLASFAFSIFVVDDMIRANAEDAQLSWFGAFVLARHFNTYYGDLALGGDSFVTSYRQSREWDDIRQRGPQPRDASQKAGMQRLASLVNASRDPFSVDRDGGWSIPLFPPINLHIRGPKIPFIGCLLCLDFSLSVTLDRNGGTDVRFVKRNREQRYNWSGVDVIAGNVEYHLSVTVLGARIINTGGRGGPPFAIGGAQAARGSGGSRSLMSFGDMWPKFAGGRVPDHGYGGSPAISPTAWLWPSPFPGDGGPFFAVSRNNINTRYRGLPRYNDTKPGADPIAINGKLKFGFEAPYLLIALVKEDPNITQSESVGRFRLDSGDAADQLGVLGKSEVFFSRPSELSYFRRADGKMELANGFNPYWQARLVDTSYLDRTAALAIQQRQPWLPRDVQVNLDHLQTLLKMLP